MIKRFFLILFGVFLSLALIEAGLRIAGGIYVFLQEQRNRASIKKGCQFRILCLGESTTAAGGEDSYPGQLERILNGRNPDIRYSVINKGRPAITTIFILNHLEENLDRYNPDLVVAMMGINDSMETVSYSSNAAINESGIGSLRVYKLARLIKEHAASRFKGFFPAVTGLTRRSEERRLVAQAAAEPWNYEVHHRLGMAYASLSRYGKADEILRKAVAIDPSRADAYIGLVLNSMELGRFDDAYAFFQNAVACGPGNATAYVALGTVYTRQERFKDADMMFDKAMALDPLNYKAYCESGISLRKRGEYPSADEMFLKAISIDPGRIEAYLGLIFSYGEQGRCNDAEDIFQKIRVRDPRNPLAYVALGKAYLNSNDPGKGAGLLVHAVALAPYLYEANNELGWMYGRQGKYESADRYLRRAVEIAPFRPEAYVGLMLSYSEQGRCDMAEDVFRKLMRFDQGNCAAYMAIGQLYSDLGRYDDASAMFEKAREADPHNYDLYLTEGHHLMRQLLIADARRSYERAIRIDPQRYEGYIGLSDSCFVSGDHAAAKEALLQAERTNPDSAPVLQSLAKIYRHEGDLKRSADLLKKALRANPNDYRSYRGLMMLREQGVGNNKDGTDEIVPVPFTQAPATLFNYRRLKAILGRRGIGLVCVQYPIRKVGILKSMFTDVRGMVFVDNEDAFTRAVKDQGYDAVFTDMFAGDFGHCTREGNRILAENVAAAILKAYFNK